MNDEIKISSKLKYSLNAQDAIIVDDDEAVSETMKMYLEDMEIFRNIILAKDGLDAQNKFSNQNFALIFLDINMPKKSGIELLKTIALKKNNIRKVIMVTGELDQKNLKAAFSKGVKNFIVKPFNEETFVNKTIEVINKVGAASVDNL